MIKIAIKFMVFTYFIINFNVNIYPSEPTSTKEYPYYNDAVFCLFTAQRTGAYPFYTPTNFNRYGTTSIPFPMHSMPSKYSFSNPTTQSQLHSLQTNYLADRAKKNMSDSTNFRLDELHIASPWYARMVLCVMCSNTPVIQPAYMDILYQLHKQYAAWHKKTPPRLRLGTCYPIGTIVDHTCDEHELAQRDLAKQLHDALDHPSKNFTLIANAYATLAITYFQHQTKTEYSQATLERYVDFYTHCSEQGF